MARPLRLDFAGALHHVTARGNARAAIFLDDDDRERFLAVLARVIKRHEWICHAYCLMGNHHHLLIETPRPSLSAGMRQLNGMYAQTFNARHGRVGHVFGGRYKALLVEGEQHLLNVAAYVVLNPVRAEICTSSADWAWSSYRATAGLERVPEFLAVDWLLSQFGDDLRIAQARYSAFVGEAALWERAEVRGQIYVGTNAFINRHAPNRPLREIPRPQWQPLPPPLPELFGDLGYAAVEVAHRRYGYPLRTIADHLGVHYSTVGRWLAAREQRDVALQDLTPDGGERASEVRKPG